MTIKRLVRKTSFSGQVFFLIFWTVPLYAPPFYSMANSTERPFRHPLSRVPPSGSIANATRLRGPFQSGVGRIKKSLLGFFYDCRIARQFCMLLSRHPWLVTALQERLKSLRLKTNHQEEPGSGQCLNTYSALRHKL